AAEAQYPLDLGAAFAKLLLDPALVLQHQGDWVVIGIIEPQGRQLRGPCTAGGKHDTGGQACADDRSPRQFLGHLPPPPTGRTRPQQKSAAAWLGGSSVALALAAFFQAPASWSSNRRCATLLPRLHTVN